MDTFRRVSNVFGIIFAWLLSILLVVMLIVAPLMLSALSMLSTDTITKVVSEALVSQAPADDDRAAQPGITLLSETSREEIPDEYEQVGGDFLSGIFGDKLQQEDVQKILSSDLVKDFIKTYTDGMTDALTGKPVENQFDAEAIKAFANEHIDEVVDIAITIVPEYAQKDTEEVKSMIRKLVDESAGDLAKALPKPEVLVENLLDQSPELEILLQIIARRNAIKWVFVGAIVLVCALIFLCRLPGLRGFRWLATDLFVGSGFGILSCFGMLVGRPAVLGMMDPQAVGIIGSLLSAFTTGLIVRTVVMLVAAAALLVAYIFIKKAWTEKTAVPEEPMTETADAVQEVTEPACEEPVEETDDFSAEVNA